MSRARISDAAVKAKTGKDWQQSFGVPDEAGAIKMSHKEIVEYLYDKRGVPRWWSQMVAITYEQKRGLREKHESPDGYSVSASKTVEVSLSTLYKHWSDEKSRKQWLKDKFTVRKSHTHTNRCA
ncbi:MAG TPA: hypothetical protein VGJ42_02555 [Nitrososphaera sp.]|jgi:hypothetical protein